MGTIKIKNLSTLTDATAVMRVASYMAGNKYDAQRGYDGAKLIDIRKRGNTYTVTDAEANE